MKIGLNKQTVMLKLSSILLLCYYFLMNSTVNGQNWNETFNQIGKICPKGSLHTYEENNGEKINIPVSRGETAIPNKYSLKSMVPPVLMQIDGSCVSFASAYYAMTTYFRKKENNRNLPPFNPMYLHARVHAFLNTCDNQQDGLNPSLALTLLRDYGIQQNESDISDELEYSTCQNMYPLEEFSIKLDSWKKLNNSNSSIDKIKHVLSKGNPVLAGISTNFSLDIYHKKYWKFFQDFATNEKNKQFLIETLKESIPDEFSSFSKKDISFEIEKIANFNDSTEFCWEGKYPLKDQGCHALCIIGYDDNRFGGAFEIVNSWSSDWGNSGYLWIRYRDFYKMYPVFYMIGK